MTARSNGKGATRMLVQTGPRKKGGMAHLDSDVRTIAQSTGAMMPDSPKGSAGMTTRKPLTPEQPRAAKREADAAAAVDEYVAKSRAARQRLSDAATTKVKGTAEQIDRDLPPHRTVTDIAETFRAMLRDAESITAAVSLTLDYYGTQGAPLSESEIGKLGDLATNAIKARKAQEDNNVTTKPTSKNGTAGSGATATVTGASDSERQRKANGHKLDCACGTCQNIERNKARKASSTSVAAPAPVPASTGTIVIGGVEYSEQEAARLLKIGKTRDAATSKYAAKQRKNASPPIPADDDGEDWASPMAPRAIAPSESKASVKSTRNVRATLSNADAIKRGIITHADIADGVQELAEWALDFDADGRPNYPAAVGEATPDEDGRDRNWGADTVATFEKLARGMSDLNMSSETLARKLNRVRRAFNRANDLTIPTFEAHDLVAAGVVNPARNNGPVSTTRAAHEGSARGEVKEKVTTKPSSSKRNGTPATAKVSNTHIEDRVIDASGLAADMIAGGYSRAETLAALRESGYTAVEALAAMREIS